ncbi:ABC transporter substrate-binding protein [Arthrobacter sp. JZ12]|uniref:metal ABC transporter solute-binding protein, Zn/Mn family n=1 Tax=Arthrobacter sp. JZ12 TaxID=2654190 RepID=UPI002B4841FF|nr:zinc ABC transporter substrate-binding protein [Arthrobacter sp. JZ12]WRH25278.1 ABC transporter substrate-binding protein [Arthrobacter sp. JZ12]
MRIKSARTTTALAAAAIFPLALAGCGQQAQGSADSGAEGIQVVTSTNVYGDIVTAVGGEHVEVTSIVNSLSQDPHSYEATVQDKLAVSKADLIVENGGGYDPFLHSLADEVDLDHEFIVSAVDVAGVIPEEESHGEDAHAEESHGEDANAEESHDEAHGHEGHDHGAFNEHVWYKLDAMADLAGVVGEKLAALDPENAETYESNAASFAGELDELLERAESLTAVADGQAVAATEPVPAYLLEAAGLENRTPADYTEAIEEGADVPVAALKEMKELVQGGSVALLAYNEQTEGPQTQAVRSAADAASVPVVNFTETLPDGEDYVSWMSANLDNIADVLNS